MKKEEVLCYTNYGTITFKGNLVPALRKNLQQYHEESNSFSLVNQRKLEGLRVYIDELIPIFRGLCGSIPDIAITIDA